MSFFQELKRQRLQVLARAFSGHGDVTVNFGTNCSTDMMSKSITLREFLDGILPGIPASILEKWICQKASCAHEAGHIRFTDNSVWQEALRNGAFFAHLLNALEDARIERAMGEKYPGVKSWYQFQNYYIFKNRLDWGSGAVQFILGICSLALIGKLPETFSEENKARILDCTALVKQAIFASNTGEVYKIVEEIYNHNRDLFDTHESCDILEPLPKILGTEKPQETPDSKNKIKATESEESGDSGDSRDSGESRDSGDSEGVEKSKEPEEFGATEDSGESTSEPDFTALLSDSKDEIDKIKRAASSIEKTPAELEANPEEISKTIAGIHSSVSLNVEPLPPNQKEYEEILSQVKPIVSKTTLEIKRILNFKNSSKYGNQQIGRLDTKRLWKLATKDPNIFYTSNAPDKIPDIAIYLLIDCSGSMYNQKKFQKAKRAAIVLSEVCRNMHIKFAVTGFSAYSHKKSVLHQQAVKFSDPAPYGVGNLHIHEENRDGYSILLASKELEVRSEKKKVLIVLSDGKPCHGGTEYFGKIGREDTARAVRDCEKRGIRVIGIYFGPQNKEYINDVSLIYNNIINLQKVDYLPVVISRELKKIILGR